MSKTEPWATAGVQGVTSKGSQHRSLSQTSCGKKRGRRGCLRQQERPMGLRAQGCWAGSVSAERSKPGRQRTSPRMWLRGSWQEWCEWTWLSSQGRWGLTWMFREELPGRGGTVGP